MSKISLRPPEEEKSWEEMSLAERAQLAELEMCRLYKDHKFEGHYYIKDKEGQIRPIGRLKRAQRKTQAVLEWCRSKGIPARVIIGKSRKQGESTFIAADCLDEVMTHGIDALILAHDRDTAEYIFGIYQRFYAKLDLPKPRLFRGKSALNKMRFDNHEGKIDVETANNKYAGTGLTPQYMHLSEASKWEIGDETLTALLQSVGKKAGTTVIFESTFNGEEGTFLPIWRKAYDNCRVAFRERTKAEGDYPEGSYEVTVEVVNDKNWNRYLPIFISVLDDEDASLPFVDSDTREKFLTTLDEREKFLLEHLEVKPEFLNWARDTLMNECRGKIDIFNQEYPVTENLAIRASGRRRFDIAKLDLMPVEDPEIGGLRYNERWDQKVLWHRDPGDLLRRFRDVVKGHRYVIGIDTAEGIVEEINTTADASVAVVLDMDRGGEQVATYCGQISPENMAVPVIMLAEYYNDAFIVAESNSTGHTLCIKLGEQYPHERLYHRDDWNQEKTRMSREVGHRTHTGNRNVLISTLADFINEDSLVVHDTLTVSELKRFIYGKSGKQEAAPGYHDDHVMAIALACMGIKVYPLRLDTQKNVAGGPVWGLINKPKVDTVIGGY